MSELRRGWWKIGRKVRTDSKGKYVKVRMEEAQHIQDAFEFVDQCGCRTMAAAELLNRGTPPEPEWLPVGVAPDREGVWERTCVLAQSPSVGLGQATETVSVTGSAELVIRNGYGMAWRADELDHWRFRYRRIGDL